YRFIEIFSIFNALSQILICKKCKEDIKFGETGNRGFKSFQNCCYVLMWWVTKIDSSPLINNVFEINRRITFVIIPLEVCKEDINIFCGLKNHTGKIIELVVKSSCCQSCIYWKNKRHAADYLQWFEDYKEMCAINLSTVEQMKIDSMKEMFARSEEEFGMKYVNEHVKKITNTRLKYLENILKTAKIGENGNMIDALVKNLRELQKRLKNLTSKHQPALSKLVQNHLLPIYKDLTMHQREGTYESGDEGLKTTLKNVGYRRAEGSSFPLGTGSDRYFPFRRGIRVSSSPPEWQREFAGLTFPVSAYSRLENPIHRFRKKSHTG
ncbi:hypothetical protein ALC56_00863, partial [Trachymyrmex septentrionalis]